jgi:hypothetical protein
MAGPVERKVQASMGAAAVSGLALWALGHYVFKGGVPDVVTSWVYVLVPAVLTFAAGYLARHTPRPDAPAGNMPANIPARGGYSPSRPIAPGLPPAPPEKTLLPPAAPE